MVTKHGKVIPHHEGLPSINSYNPLNMCYLNYHNAYSHKAYPSGDILQEILSHKFGDHLRSHEKLNTLFGHL